MSLYNIGQKLTVKSQLKLFIFNDLSQPVIICNKYYVVEIIKNNNISHSCQI